VNSGLEPLGLVRVSKHGLWARTAPVVPAVTLRCIFYYSYGRWVSKILPKYADLLKFYFLTGFSYSPPLKDDFNNDSDLVDIRLGMFLEERSAFDYVNFGGLEDPTPPSANDVQSILKNFDGNFVL
jgi:hypothetical protein